MTPCAIPVPKVPSNSEDVMVSPTTNVPTIFVKNNSVTSNAPDTKFSTLSTVAVAEDVAPVIILDSNRELTSLVITLRVFSLLKSPDDGFSKSSLGL